MKLHISPKALLLSICFLVIVPLNLYALSITTVKVGDNTTDIQNLLGTNTAIDSWLAGGQREVLEDFENSATGWATTLVSSNLGTFTAGGNPGTGSSSYSQSTDPEKNSSDVKFQIVDSTNLHFGRFNTTPDGSRFLDSADISEIKLVLDSGLNISKLFFFLTDPGDVQATTTIGSSTVIASIADADIDPASNRDKSLWFVGIDAGADYISQIVWSVSNNNDGFGVDDFTRVSAVPEPGTLLLLGSGMAGLALYRRKTNKV